ncbi:hypothetical protein QJS10_CPA01g00717 [Acorus calamus]|uniref:Uncharacterized protein n=1 Tax=Acorus calamus TaxID=4465 RepID=A0AAV9FI22_ACOCL|nr:hypothetical protein QJS10_CPA01g00717 [Acorus calamus]
MRPEGNEDRFAILMDRREGNSPADILASRRQSRGEDFILPHQSKMSIPITISRVLKYIPELQKHVEGLRRLNEEMMEDDVMIGAEILREKLINGLTLRFDGNARKMSLEVLEKSTFSPPSFWVSLKKLIQEDREDSMQDGILFTAVHQPSLSTISPPLFWESLKILIQE